MESVRLGKTLIARILECAYGKMTAQVLQVTQKGLGNEYGQRIYDTLFGAIKPLALHLPDGWVRMVKSFIVCKVCGQVCDLRFTFTIPQPWPYDFDTELARSGISPDRVILKTHPTWGWLLPEVLAYNKRVQEAEERRRKFVAKVRGVLEGHNTLQKALNEWPPLWELLPDDVKARCRKPVKKLKDLPQPDELTMLLARGVK